MDNPQPDKSDYSRYQTDPHGFCSNVFGETYTEDVISVMESVRDNPVTIARSANATGKSHGAARIAVWFYKCFPDAQVYTTAAPPEKNLRKIMWGELGSLSAKHPEVFSADKVSQDMNIQKDPLSFITGVSIPMAGSSEVKEAKFSGKHAPNLLFIVDEGDAVPEEVYKGIESCMSGGNARLLVMFNPRGEYGHIAKMEKQGQGHVCKLSALRHPNVVSGDDIIPGAVSRVTTVRRINEWTRALAPDEKPDSECFELPEYLVGCTCESKGGETFQPLPSGWRKVVVTAFFYMVLGEYPPQAESQLISRAWVDAAISRWLTYVSLHGEKPPVKDAIAGLDVSEFGKDWNVLMTRYSGWVAKPQRWQGIDPDATAIKAAGIVKATPATIKVNVDGTGLGSGVAPRMTRLGCKAFSIKVASSPTYETEMGKFMMLRDELWWSCMVWLRDDVGAMLPPDDELTEELTTPTYSIRNGKIKIIEKEIMREMLGRSPDKADALNLTFAKAETVSINAFATVSNYAR